MTKASGIGFNPGLGIERVIAPHDGPGISVLPGSTRVLPSEAAMGMESLHHFYSPAWDQEMLDFLQPHIHARELLIPGVFAARIRQARNQFEELARQTGSTKLKKAADLLEEDKELRALLDTYRNLLIAG